MKSLAYIPGSNGLANASLMTVQTLRAPGAATILVNTVSGLPTKFYGSMGAPHTFTDPVTGETITLISEATAVDAAFSVSGSSITIDAIAPGYTDTRGSLVGDIVVVRPVTEWANNIFNLLSQSHNDDGTLKESAITFDPTTGDYIQGGSGIWTIASGLNGAMTALTGWITGRSGTITAVASRAYTASKDTYVDVLRNTTTGVFSLVYTEVANGAASPTLAANSLRLAKIVTSGSAITSVVQTRQDTLGNSIYPSAPISPAQLNPNGYFYDSYAAGGLTGPGEYNISGTMKTFDLTAIPTGHLFMATVAAFSGSVNQNVKVQFTYNGNVYSADQFGSYHISASVTIPVQKVAGQNSLTIQYGGGAGGINISAWIAQVN